MLARLWRVTNKGHWPEFSTDIEAKDIEQVLQHFELKQKSRGSVACRKEIIKIELLGDSET